MIARWEKVHIFISSTFNDMHAERDYLVKQVFPELTEWCEKRRLKLIDIDLRWGVSELDAYEAGDSSQLFVLTAPGGMGKSMLLANWITRYTEKNPEVDKTCRSVLVPVFERYRSSAP